MASIYCSKCKGIPRDSVDSDCCSQIYCWNCVVNGTICSFCGQPVDPAKCKENLAVRRVIESMPKNCRYEGCQLVLTSDKLKEHEPVCQFKPVVCPNNELCGIFLSLELQEHLNVCDYRIVDCAFKCGTKLAAKDFQSHITKDCPEVTIMCSNMCNTQVKRGELTSHMQNNCPYQPIPCEFTEYGCTKTLLRMNYSEHLESNMKEHFFQLSKAVKNQSNEIKALKQNIQQISNNTRPIIDRELIHNGFNHFTQNIGQCLEATRLAGCQIIANSSICTNTSLISSRIAQFVLGFLLYVMLARVKIGFVFLLFVATAGFTFFRMFRQNNSFTTKMIKVVAWACIFAIIFHAPADYHYQHHRHRYY